MVPQIRPAILPRFKYEGGDDDRERVDTGNPPVRWKHEPPGRAIDRKRPRVLASMIRPIAQWIRQVEDQGFWRGLVVSNLHRCGSSLGGSSHNVAPLHLPTRARSFSAD